jgi:hypothetical protein
MYCVRDDCKGKLNHPGSKKYFQFSSQYPRTSAVAVHCTHSLPVSALQLVYLFLLFFSSENLPQQTFHLPVLTSPLSLYQARPHHHFREHLCLLRPCVRTTLLSSLQKTHAPTLQQLQALRALVSLTLHVPTLALMLHWLLSSMAPTSHLKGASAASLFHPSEKPPQTPPSLPSFPSLRTGCYHPHHHPIPAY